MASSRTWKLLMRTMPITDPHSAIRDVCHNGLRAEGCVVDMEAPLPPPGMCWAAPRPRPGWDGREALQPVQVALQQTRCLNTVVAQPVASAMQTYRGCHQGEVLVIALLQISQRGSVVLLWCNMALEPTCGPPATHPVESDRGTLRSLLHFLATNQRQESQDGVASAAPTFALAAHVRAHTNVEGAQTLRSTHKHLASDGANQRTHFKLSANPRSIPHRFPLLPLQRDSLLELHHYGCSARAPPVGDTHHKSPTRVSVCL